FRQYATLGDDAATSVALQIWDDINGPNLRQFIAPTMPRATVILRKDADHSVASVSIRLV
ncbi:MAG: type I pantothenate kinase, partial [Propionibacteriaceae bacterium]|nr:type I pantothenate kinase [Propionibacteriaceae bacterium]